MASGSQTHSETMPTPAVTPPEPGRRKTLALLVNTVLAVIGAAFSGLLGVFAVRPARRATTERWIRAGTLGDLTPNVPVPRVLSVPRADGWYRARARETVFLVWDGAKQVNVVLRHVHAPRLSGALGRRGEEVQLPLPRRHV